MAHRTGCSLLPGAGTPLRCGSGPRLASRAGCEWCCCSGSCSLLDFLPGLRYNYRGESLGLCPVQVRAIQDVLPSSPAPSASPESDARCCAELQLQQRRAGQAAEVAQSFPLPPWATAASSAVPRGRQLPCGTHLVMLSPGLGACTAQETHHRQHQRSQLQERFIAAA